MKVIDYAAEEDPHHDGADKKSHEKILVLFDSRHGEAETCRDRQHKHQRRRPFSRHQSDQRDCAGDGEGGNSEIIHDYLKIEMRLNIVGKIGPRLSLDEKLVVIAQLLDWFRGHAADQPFLTIDISRDH